MVAVLASCRVVARDALVRLVPDILPSVDICSAQDCARLLWAYRRADPPAARCQELVVALLERCARCRADLSARDCATVLWAGGHFCALKRFPKVAMHDVIQVSRCICTFLWVVVGVMETATSQRITLRLMTNCC